MYYDYKHALAELRRRQAKERPLLLAAGVSEADIADLFRFERRQLDHDTVFYLGLDGYIEHNDARLEDEPRYSFELLDELDNQRLHAALIKLKHDERALVILHVVGGFTLKQISTLWDKPYEALAKRYKRAIEKLKKFL